MTDYIIDHLLEIIAIIAAFVIFLLQIRKKALSYTILTNTSVVSVSDKVKEGIQILYNGVTVPNLWLVEIRIKNTGNLPIKPDDYVEPLAVHYPKSEVFTLELSDTNALGAYVDGDLFDPNRIVLSKTLLNPKDFYDIKIVMAGDKPDLSVVGRIVGVSKIQKLKERQKILPHLDVRLLLFLLIAVGISSVLYPSVSQGIAMAFIILTTYYLVMQYMTSSQSAEK